MSSTILYRALGFRQYQCLRTTTDNGVVTLHLRQDPKHDRCSHCQSPDVVRHGTEERTVRTVPIGGKPVELRLPVPRLGCRMCGLVRQAAIRFARPFRRFTHAFERYALGLLAHMTIRAVADHLKVGWDSIKTLFKRHLKTRFGQPKLERATSASPSTKSRSATATATSPSCSTSSPEPWCSSARAKVPTP